MAKQLLYWTLVDLYTTKVYHKGLKATYLM